MQIIKLDQIKAALKSIDLLAAMEAGFIAYSEGNAVIPPVGELLFEQPPGDVHIKYGYLKGDDYYVIKIASGFYDNPKLNLPSSNGLMLLFNQKTGELLSVLLDEGYLTDLRTAAAGAVVAKYLAPKVINGIGIVGTGIQARLQLRLLTEVTPCRKVLVWGRTLAHIERYKEEMQLEGFSIDSVSLNELAAQCDLIVTTTPTTQPLLKAASIQPGTHITAVGSDTPQKQELDADILAKADLVVADSIAQCVERGEISHAVENNLISKDNIVEIGQIISDKTIGRISKDQITVADLTGVAVQDIEIAKAVYEAINIDI